MVVHHVAWCMAWRQVWFEARHPAEAAVRALFQGRDEPLGDQGLGPLAARVGESAFQVGDLDRVGVDGDWGLGHDAPERPHVVGVLVGEEDPLQGAGVEAFHRPEDAPGHEGEPRVHQSDAAFRIPDQPHPHRNQDPDREAPNVFGDPFQPHRGALRYDTFRHLARITLRPMAPTTTGHHRLKKAMMSPTPVSAPTRRRTTPEARAQWPSPRPLPTETTKRPRPSPMRTVEPWKPGHQAWGQSMPTPRPVIRPPGTR